MRSLLTLLRVSRAAVCTRGESGGARGMVVAVLCAVVGALGLTAGPVSALETHVFSSSFGSAGSGAGQLSSPSGVAVNSITHDVYVADGGNLRVDEFTSSGTFIRAWGWGVADGLPALETCTLICQAGISGSGPGQFTTPGYIAVDNSAGPSAGNVYVGDIGDDLVSKFDSSGNLISSWGSRGQIDGSTAADGPFKSIFGVTVDSVGTLYVDDTTDHIFEFAQDGSFKTDFRLQGSPLEEGGLVVDPSGNIIAIGDEGGGAGEYTGTGSEIGALSGERSGVNDAGRSTGLALDSSTGDVYVARHNIVQHYAFTGIGQVREVGGGTCSLGGRGSGGCPATDNFGSGTLPSDPNIGAVGVGFDVGRVYVVDAAQQRVDTFTPATLADTTTEAAAPVGKTTAGLHGTVNPVGIEVTSCEFEWGTETKVYPNKIPCSSTPGSGSAPVEVAAELTGLAPETNYFYRLTVANAEGVNRGKQESFTTSRAVDALGTGPAEGATATGATLTGSLSPDGADTHYYFEYGTDKSYGSTSPAPPGTDAGNASESVKAETVLAGLVANTVYHYRLVGVNSFGTTFGEDAVFTTPGPPSIVSDSAEVKPTEQVGQTNATLQAQVNPDGRETAYHFEFGETTSYGTSVPVPAGELGSGEEPVASQAELSGLKIGTTYHYRVVASNEYGTVEGADQTFTTLPAVLIDSESASTVTAVSASLSAQVNALGRDTHAYFQYGPLHCAPSACIDLPLPPGIDLGAPESDQSLDVHVQGLASGTVYEYRVIATSAIGTIGGPTRTFTTQESASEFTQPDGRAWELVSPPNKQGAGIIAVGNEQGSDIQAAASGGAITYTATAAFVANPTGNRAIETTQVISRRQAPAVWETADITTADNDGPTGFAAGHSSEYKLFSSDLSLGFVEPADRTPLQPGVEGSQVYVRKANGEYEGLTSSNVPAGAKFGGEFVSASPDGSHVILKSRTKLTSAAIPSNGGPALYEWSAGQLQLASVLPNGNAESGALGERNEVVTHAISSDGSRVIWTAENGHLYIRDMARKETLQVDAAQGAPEPVSVRVRYRAADREDSRVFFTTNDRLTGDSTAGETKEDLYEFEVTSGAGELLAGKLTDLTVDHNLGESADVKGVIGASEDGSYVVFVAAGVLGDTVEQGVSRGSNLYVEHLDLGTKKWGPPTFVDTLAEGDKPDWTSLGGGNNGSGGMTSRVSPSGRYLAFMSERSLTGYENRDASSGIPDEEVFIYDANTDRVVCASCDPTGAQPIGLHEGELYEENLVDYARNWDGRWIAGNVPGWTTTDLAHSLYQSRYLSDSGRLFFNSSDALVPADVNGKEDVYEYEPDGIGGCQGSGHGQSASVVFNKGMDGCVALISAGSSTEESAFMDASESSGDVFFLTLSRLSPQDYDNSIDLYDARECTPSLPCAPAPPLSPPPCATGDACKPAPTPQPALFGAPSSATFSGAGNIEPSASKLSVTQRQATQTKKLLQALKVCHKKPKRQRSACERRARRKFEVKRSHATKSLSARNGR